jgi:hypothetical protein
MDATDPQPHADDGPRPQDLKRGGKRALLVLLAVIAVLAIAVALTNLGGDDDPSGGGDRGMGSTTLQLVGAP